MKKNLRDPFSPVPWRYRVLIAFCLAGLSVGSAALFRQGLTTLGVLWAAGMVLAAAHVAYALRLRHRWRAKAWEVAALSDDPVTKLAWVSLMASASRRDAEAIELWAVSRTPQQRKEAHLHLDGAPPIVLRYVEGLRNPSEEGQ